jgi:hypothetical protein
MATISTAERLRRLIQKGELVILNHRPNPPNVIGFPTLASGPSAEWAAQSINALRELFGRESAYVVDFPSKAKEGYVHAVKAGVGILRAAAEDAASDLSPASSIPASIVNAPLERIGRICDRFHLVARPLAKRQRARVSVLMADEYDVQDVLHALLKLDFDDVRPEEYVPSYAGKASRMDFLLKNEAIVVEAKFAGKKLSAANVGSQLIDDIARYQTHPGCRTLVCFVYDPEATIDNPRGLEADLSRSEGTLSVMVMIRPC